MRNLVPFRISLKEKKFNLVNKSQFLPFLPLSSSFNKIIKFKNQFYFNHSSYLPKNQFYQSLRKMSNNVNQYVLTEDNINQNVRKMEYAVRGPIVIRAGELEQKLKKGETVGDYSHIIRANIGDCHATGQAPLTFVRQVLACCVDKSLIENSNYPSEVKERASFLLNNCGGGSVGAYSDSAGIQIIRTRVAEFISNRDNIKCDWQNIVLTGGASEGIRSILELVNNFNLNDKPIGALIPIPQYPLYSATLVEYGMYPINYYLNEGNEWSLDIQELKRALKESYAFCRPRIICVINPGNPTGSILSRKNIEDVILFAKENNLLIIADEVYQHNIWKQGSEFNSFKKVMHDLNIKLELASVMSISKGFMGECGLRAGYCEISNFKTEVRTIFLKMLSARLCCSILGQIALDCIIKPPSKDPSLKLFIKEREYILSELKNKAELVVKTFNSIPGFKCNNVAGAMYAFPEITLPLKAIEKAKSLNIEPDFFYAMSLLEKTGVCIVPGSGFGQRPNSYHFRTTILPPKELMEEMMDKLKKFHNDFIEEFK